MKLYDRKFLKVNTPEEAYYALVYKQEYTSFYEEEYWKTLSPSIEWLETKEFPIFLEFNRRTGKWEDINEVIENYTKRIEELKAKKRMIKNGGDYIKPLCFNFSWVL